MTPNKSQIKARIEELEVMLADATPEQIAKSKSDSVRLSEILDELKDESGQKDTLVEEFKTLDLTLNNAFHELKNFKDTMAADLMVVSTRYVVINNKDLISPAGFHPDEKVYIQSTIAIHTDSLENLPSSNEKLYAFEVNALAIYMNRVDELLDDQ
jgi:hypothetical protein